MGKAPACVPVLEAGWIRAAPPGTTALAGYAVLRNGCKAPAQVRDVKSPAFAMGMIHETRIENGISRMRQARSLSAPAGGELRFEPGGTHLMLMHPRRNLKEGDRVPVELLLEGGTRVSAEFEVRREAPPRAAR